MDMTERTDSYIYSHTHSARAGNKQRAGSTVCPNYRDKPGISSPTKEGGKAAAGVHGQPGKKGQRVTSCPENAASLRHRAAPYLGTQKPSEIAKIVGAP